MMEMNLFLDQVSQLLIGSEARKLITLSVRPFQHDSGKDCVVVGGGVA